MATMNVNDMKAAARATIVTGLEGALSDMSAIQFADNSWAIQTEIEGQVIWVEVNVKSKAFKATKTYDAFDPEEARTAWLEEKRLKEQEAVEKAKKKGE